MKNKNVNPLLHALLPTAAVITYVLLGYIFKGAGWRTGWLVFLLIPVIESASTAVKTKNPSAFVYPVLVTGIFLAVVLFFHIWHPTWVLFLTIPAFYAICNYVNRNRQQKAYENCEQNPDIHTPPPYTASANVNAPIAAPPTVSYQQSSYAPPKKTNIVPIIVSVIFSITAIVIAAIIGVFSLAGKGFSWISGLDFDNDGTYTEVNTSAEIDANGISELDIEWIDGNINIEYYDGEKIHIEESGNISKPMCYKIEGTTLKIDEYLNSNKVGIKTASKNLTVKLPLDFNANEIDISVVSATVRADALNVGKLDFETVSGNGEFVFAESPREIDTDSVSGKVKIILPEDVTGYSASLDAVSGSLIASGFGDSGNNTYYGDGAVIIDSESVSGNLVISKAEAKGIAA